MTFRVVCHICGHILYEGNDMIPLYCLRRKTDGKCPSCKRKLATHPINISINKELLKNDLPKINSR